MKQFILNKHEFYRNCYNYIDYEIVNSTDYRDINYCSTTETRIYS